MNRRSKRAFTLIELLVVIAIVAILAALLYPVFVSARSRARTAACYGNLQELTRALLMYTSDYNGVLPRAQFCSEGYGHEMYHPYVRNYSILRCPGDPVRGRTLGRIGQPAYAYNQHCLCAPLSVMSKSKLSPAVADVYGLDQKKITQVYGPQAVFPYWPGRPLGDVKNASRCPAMFCSESHHGSRWTGENYGYGWQPEDASDWGRMVNPHGGGANYAFLDGHVKWYLPNGGYFAMRTDGIDYDGNGTVGEQGFMR